MDPFSVTAASITIARLCAQCIVALTLWVGEVRTVDSRIESFCTEIKNLSSNLEALNNAAQLSEALQDDDDAQKVEVDALWNQLRASLTDCERTMEQLRDMLEKLKTNPQGRLGFLRRPIKQFRESLESGDIAQLRERILSSQIFGKAAALQHQFDLSAKLDNLDAQLQTLTRKTLSRRPKSKKEDPADGIHELVLQDRVRETTRIGNQFIARARSIATNSRASTIRASNDRSVTLTSQHANQTRAPSARGTFDTESYAYSQQVFNIRSSETDFDLDLELVTKYLQNGQSKYNNSEWQDAETCFRMASAKLSNQALRAQIHLDVYDVHLMTAAACMKQKKYDEVKTLLRPLTDTTKSSTQDRPFVACHILADLYLYENDLKRAELFGRMAVYGRRKLLGRESALCLSSMRLLVTIYDKKQDAIELDAWTSVLRATELKMSASTDFSRSSTFSWRGNGNFTDNASFVITTEALCDTSNLAKMNQQAQHADVRVPENPSNPIERDGLRRPIGRQDAPRPLVNATARTRSFLGQRHGRQSLGTTDVETVPTVRVSQLATSSSLVDRQNTSGGRVNHRTLSQPFANQRLVEIHDETIRPQNYEIQRQRPAPSANYSQLPERGPVEVNPGIFAGQHHIEVQVEGSHGHRDTPSNLVPHTVETHIPISGTSQSEENDWSPWPYEKVSRNVESMIGRSALGWDSYDDTRGRLQEPTFVEILPQKVHVAQEHGPSPTSFQLFFGSILVLFEPRSLLELQRITFLSSDTVSTLLGSVDSYFNWSLGQHVIVNTSNFDADFWNRISDPSLCPDKDQLIDRQMAHRHILDYCLKYLSSNLKRNMLEHNPKPKYVFGWSTTPLENSTDFPKAQRFFPSFLQYACEHWVDHLCQVKMDFPMMDNVSEMLQSHLLHWIEACGQLNKISEVIEAVGKLRTIFDTTDPISPPQLTFRQSRDLLQSAERLLIRNRDILHVAPLQIYGTCLVFEPQDSIVIKVFAGEMPLALKKKPMVEETRSACLYAKPDHHRYPSGYPSMAISSDGRTLANTDRYISNRRRYDRSNIIRTCDLATGRHRQTMFCDSECTCLAFSPIVKSYLLAAGSDNGDIDIWNALDGVRSTRLEGHTSKVEKISFSTDGLLLCSASADKTLRLWDMSTFESVRSLSGHEGGLTDVQFSPDNALVVSSSSGIGTQETRIWKIADGSQLIQPVQTYSGHSPFVMSNSGAYIAFRNYQALVLWNRHTGLYSAEFDVGNDTADAVAFSPDDKLLACGLNDCTINIWSIVSREKIKVIPAAQNERGHVANICFSCDAEALIVSSWDCTIRIWETKTWQYLACLTGHSSGISPVMFSPLDKQILISRGWDRTVRVWDLAKVQSQKTLAGHCGAIKVVTLSRDGRLLATAGQDSSMKLWCTASGSVKATYSMHSRGVSELAFSPDGEYLAGASYDNMLHLWNVKTTMPHGILAGHSRYISRIRFSQSSTLIASYDGEYIMVWDVKRKTSVYKLESKHHCWDFLFLPDHSLLIDSWKKGGLWLRDAGTDNEPSLVLPHEAPALDLQLSKDGTLVFASMRFMKDEIVVWNWRSRQVVANIPAKIEHPMEWRNEPHQILIISPDNRFVAYNSGNSVSICEVAKQKTIGSYTPISLRPFRFSEDSSYLQMGFERVDLVSFQSKNSPDSSCTVNQEGDWLFAAGEPVVWLPPDRRYEWHISIRDDLMALGHGSGYITLVSSDKKPDLTE